MESIDLELAKKILLDNISPIEEFENKNLLDSLGYILGENIYSPIDNPPFNRSPLDGFSFDFNLSKGASKNTPINIKIIDEICAGDNSFLTPSLKEGVRIMTGAPIPNTCNCVIMQEEVDFNENTNILTIYRELKEFENYCFKGEDVKFNQLILEKNTLITYSHLGILASLGISEIKVYKKPTIGILSFGSELLMPGMSLTPGKIYNSNLFTLSGRLKELNLNPKIYPIIEDDPILAIEFIEKILPEIDFLITTGGVSVGKKDIVHDIIKITNSTRLFWKVNLQPGTPVLAWKMKNKLILSLSGNPFASLVNFELLARDVLSKLTHGLIKLPTISEAIISGEFSKYSKKRRFIRAFYDKGIVYVNNNKHSSGMISSLINKNALIDIAPGTNPLSTGDKVKVILID